MSDQIGVRVTVRGQVQQVGFRDATQRAARRLGVLGWVRNGTDGSVQVHAEGTQDAVQELLAFLRAGPPQARITDVQIAPAKVEGHEQFAVRGVSAGRFVVWRADASAGPFGLGLEVGGALRSWAVPKGPSMDPAVKRLAVEAADHPADADPPERAVIWDQGPYEQGGRVPWPQALTRGHAVFVLHGEKLRGGFALQRTRPGPPGQWLLVKRRDDDARPGSSSP